MCVTGARVFGSISWNEGRQIMPPEALLESSSKSTNNIWPECVEVGGGLQLNRVISKAFNRLPWSQGL